MLAGTLVRLTKVSSENESTLPDAYWLEGRILKDLAVGSPIEVWRHRRAQQRPDEPLVNEVTGHFVSSPIRALTIRDGATIAATHNSHWEVRPL